MSEERQVPEGQGIHIVNGRGRRSSKEPSDETSATQSSSIAARQGITRPCNTFLALATMRCSVACSAQRDQVGLGVGSRMAAEFSMTHLKIRHRATGLTPPAVATQNLLAQLFLRPRVQTRGRGFGANRSHDAFSPRVSRKPCFYAPGKNS